MAKITNVRVYGLEESMVASSYPMKEELDGDFDNLVNSVYEPSEKGSRYDKAKRNLLKHRLVLDMDSGLLE